MHTEDMEDIMGAAVQGGLIDNRKAESFMVQYRNIREPKGCNKTDRMRRTLELVKLDRGAHRSRERGMCLMEAAAYIAGEPLASPIGGRFRSFDEALEAAKRVVATK